MEQAGDPSPAKPKNGRGPSWVIWRVRQSWNKARTHFHCGAQAAASSQPLLACFPSGEASDILSWQEMSLWGSRERRGAGTHILVQEEYLHLLFGEGPYG